MQRRWYVFSSDDREARVAGPFEEQSLAMNAVTNAFRREQHITTSTVLSLEFPLREIVRRHCNA